MIAFNGKVTLRGGLEHVLVLRDHMTPSLYYCASLRPRVAKRDASYQFALVRYQSISDNVKRAPGVLALVVDLALTDQEEKQVTSALKKDGDAETTLRPVPWSSGTASVSIDDQRVDGQSSLFGDNSLTIRLDLDDDQASRLVRSLEQGASPLSVTYKLTYPVLQPVSRWHARMDWKMFYEFVERECKVSLLFLNFSSVDTFERLRKEKVLTIEGTEYEDETAHDLKLDFLRSLGMLFKPLPDPSPLKKWGDGGDGLIFGCRQLKEITEVRQTGDVTLDVQEAAARPVFLQSVVTDLAEAYKKAGGATVFDLSAGMPLQQKLTINCLADFDADKIVKIKVSFSDSDRVDPEVTFRKGDPLSQSHDITLAYDRENQKTYQWWYEVTLSNTGGVLETLTSDKTEVDRYGRFLVVQPSEIYTRRAIPVVVPKNFPWEVIESIDVKLKWTKNDPDAPPVARFTLHNEKEALTTTWDFFRPERVDPAFVYELTYYDKNNGNPLETDWSKGSTAIRVYPRVQKLKVDARGVDWNRVNKIEVDLWVDQPSRDQVLGLPKQPLKLDKKQPQHTLSFLNHPPAPGPLKVRYSARFYDRDEQQLDESEGEERSAIILVYPNPHPHQPSSETHS